MVTKSTQSAADATARERASQRELMARKRAAGRDLQIPPVANPRRRRRCQKEPALFLKTYFPTIFFNPFTSNQRGIIDGFVERLHYGGWKAEAAPRGEGKTSIARGLAIYAIIYGLRGFVVIVAANAREAEANLDNIRAEFERNDLLADDFPEVCAPIRALEGASQRAKAQTVNGERTYLKWTGDLIHMPTVVGSDASGGILTSRGIESAIHGMNYRGRRPDFVLIDDPETEESVDSEIETARRERIIDGAITGLAGQDRRIAIFYTCTIWSSASLAAKYTDPTIKSAWDGHRRKLLVQKPDREELWERYMDLRTAGVLKGDRYGREAHRLYLAHRRQMDAGAVVSNPYRFDATTLPDGSQVQVSALQFCYDTIADTSWEYFNTEFQNEPPAQQAGDTVEITDAIVMGRCNGLDRGTVPADADHLTAGLDISGRVVHWVVAGWKQAAGSVIDYGAIPVHSPLVGNLEDPENVQAVQDAILTALVQFRDMAEEGWPDAESGELRYLDVALIDTGYARSSMDTPVYEFVRTGPASVYRAAKGFGTGAGAGSGRTAYHHPTKRGHGRRLYNHCFATWQPTHRTWLHNCDADFWKTFVHTGLMAPVDRPGSLTLFGRDPVAHKQFARQITAEVWTHEYRPGKGDVWSWKSVRQQNHWFDCLYLACVGAGIKGLKTTSERPARKTKRPPDPAQKPVKLSDLRKK